MSEYNHLHPQFKHVMDMEIAERLRFIEEDRWIDYASARDLIAELRGLMLLPAREKMPNRLIVSEPNNGKTTIINRFFQLYGEGYIDATGVAHKPVIVAQAPVTPDEKALYLSILDCFWASFRESDSTLKLRNQVMDELRRNNVKMLIIDEMNSLLCGSPAKQRQVMNALKNMCNMIKIPIVGFGTREAVRVLHTDPQHVSRFRVVPLPLWACDEHFQKLIFNFEGVLPLQQPSNLAEPAMVKLLFKLSNGNLGNLREILREAAKLAITHGKEHIDKQLLESVSF